MWVLSRLLTVQAFGKPAGIVWVAYNWPRWEYLNHGDWQMLHMRALLPAQPPAQKARGGTFTSFAWV